MLSMLAVPMGRNAVTLSFGTTPPRGVRHGRPLNILPAAECLNNGAIVPI